MGGARVYRESLVQEGRAALDSESFPGHEMKHSLVAGRIASPQSGRIHGIEG